MLLNQGRPAWKAWFGLEPEVTPELREMIEATIPKVSSLKSQV
jgi:shikimate dehydrogenase